MTWLVESYDRRTDELLADFDLNVLAALAVEHLIGTRPEVLSPDQVRVVAPLFDVEPDHWEGVVQSLTGDGVFGPDWLSRALAHLVSAVVDQNPENLVGVVWPIPEEVAQGLLDRFSTDVRLPDGEVFIDFAAPWPGGRPALGNSADQD